ncbi:hypothetical protein LTR59_009334 [Friedmanniomyces endolithicus]|nr:hypothetical protein LTS09_016948 [Friedmanniomyces endolithicus]KAK0790234.1 hypothetical protein LTR59_009334 [Friedmanniomyces endolithicus]KAK0833554.1 hypothetical protein LTR03_014653 [Friedmanniomyces endolithicus]
MALPPELRNWVYELVFADEDEIIEIYPEHMEYGDEDRGPCLWQPAITKVSRELRHETLSIFYGRTTFHVPLTSTCHGDGMDYDSDDDGSGYGSEYEIFFNDTMERFWEFREHVERWFRTNAEHLRLMKTLTMEMCVRHAAGIKVVVSDSAVQSTMTIEPESALLGSCRALGAPGERQLAARVESVLGAGTARQPHLTLDVCVGLLDLMGKYGAYIMASTDTEHEPLLRHVPSALPIPPVLVQPGVEKLDTPVTISEDAVFPIPTFTLARLDAQKRKVPQCIAHRGYKAKFPENTMAAFKGAVAAGAHALETDVHITKDNVVVLSHDPTLKRCFGRPEKIIDTPWDTIKDLRTIAEPHEPMPQLRDVITYLAQPAQDSLWILLDIKLDNDAESIMRLLGSTLASIAPSATTPWRQRVVLGIWAAKFLPLAQQYLPDFPVMHIGFSTSYARHFLKVPNIGFNMLLPILIAPGGRSFLRDARKDHRQVLAWTVNAEDRMEWCIRRKLDGVITDDPEKFLRVCERFDERERESLLPSDLRSFLYMHWTWVFITVALWWYKGRFMPVASREMIKRKGASTASTAASS